MKVGEACGWDFTRSPLTRRLEAAITWNDVRCALSASGWQVQTRKPQGFVVSWEGKYAFTIFDMDGGDVTFEGARTPIQKQYCTEAVQTWEKFKC